MRVTASKLNVRSGPGTDFRVLGYLFQGEHVEVKERHGDWAWVMPFQGWVHASYLEDAAVAAPTGIKQLIEVFGPAGGPKATAGRAQLPLPLKLSWDNASVQSFVCHELLAGIFTEVFATIHREGLWHHLKEFGGCYSKRPMRLGSKLSTHSWGIAVDLNPASNAQGTKGDMHEGIVRIFEEAGFQWGGRWSGSACDPMHFQYASGY